jgi:membrane complex biogenesis BtpA family protein
MNRNEFHRLLGPERPALIGVCHLPPLPGSPRHADPIAALVERAVSDARGYEEGGMAAVLVENYGDHPLYPDDAPKETVAALTAAAVAVRRAVSIPVGVNVLRNDAHAALAVAAAADLAFIRVNVHMGAVVTDQGILQGRAHETLRLRARIAPAVRIFADVHVKHGRPLGNDDPVLAAQEVVTRGLADGVIVTGPATGVAADLDRVRLVRAALVATPVLVGSGVTAETAGDVLRLADGAIVGTAAKRGGVTEAAVDPDRVRALVRSARGA